MKAVFKAFLLLVFVLLLIAAAAVAYVLRNGVSAREQPGAIETAIAHNLRTVATARRASGLHNPVTRTPEVIAEGRAHYADHCAVCHANDGSGKTEMGQGLWPKAPDMRQDETQKLSDGELFWIIENGIRFTGMPGWGNGTREGEEGSWHLVHFIRHLPDLSESELAAMEDLNPKPPAEIRQQIEQEEFLKGSDPKPGEPAKPHGHSGG